jgi:hypothetical protein
MRFGVPGLKKILLVCSVLVCAAVSLVSCGSSSKKTNLSGLTYRAFVSNPIQSGIAGSIPALQIVNAFTDQVSPFSVSLSGTLVQPQLLAESPDLRFTLVFSSQTNQLALVSNSTESIASINGMSVPAATLPGPTSSMFVATNISEAYAAVPTAPILAQPPGAVVVVNITNGTLLATIPVVSAHYVVQSHNGNYVLAFSDNSNSITLISPSLIGSSQDPRTTICCFDRPVWAVFSADDSTAYVFNCGAECGGTSASITPLNLPTLTPGTPVPVSGATYGIQYGNNLYVVGSPPGQKCAGGTAAAACGTLNLVNVNSLTVQNSTPYLIADGYHSLMEVSQDGQLYVGSQGCSNVDVASGEVRGCLSIFNTVSPAVVVPPETGDVTGIAPVPGRPVVYVVQNLHFWIYNTKTNQLEVQTLPTYLPGRPYDVKMVDPPMQ